MKALFLAIFMFFLSACSSSCALFTHPVDETKLVNDLYEHTVMLRINILAVNFEKTEKGVFANTLPISTLGSGAVLAVKKDKSLVLTANHVCAVPLFILHKKKDEVELKKYNIFQSQMHIITISGERLVARPIFNDVTNDLCVVEVDGVAGKPVKIARSMPMRGSKVFYLGSPLGVFDINMTFIGEGRYMGSSLRDSKIRELFSTPTTRGSSGSGVYHKGELIGVVSAALLDFNQVSICIALDKVREAFNKSQEIWSN